VREERRSFREEITTVVAGPLSCANDWDDDEDEEEEQEEEPVWSAPDGHRSCWPVILYLFSRHPRLRHAMERTKPGSA
jgi:hypothetical protein